MKYILTVITVVFFSLFFTLNAQSGECGNCGACEFATLENGYPQGVTPYLGLWTFPTANPSQNQCCRRWNTNLSNIEVEAIRIDRRVDSLMWAMFGHVTAPYNLGGGVK